MTSTAETFEGAQEMESRATTSPSELARELGVLRLPEGANLDPNDYHRLRTHLRSWADVQATLLGQFANPQRDYLVSECHVEARARVVL